MERQYIELAALEKEMSKSMRIASLYHPSEFLEIAESVPAADVRPVVRGRRIKPEPGDGTPYCSNCKRQAPAAGELYWYPDLCPSCGADMRTGKA